MLLLMPSSEIHHLKEDALDIAHTPGVGIRLLARLSGDTRREDMEGDGTISLGTTRTPGRGMQTPPANLTIGSQLSTARSRHTWNSV